MMRVLVLPPNRETSPIFPCATHHQKPPRNRPVRPAPPNLAHKTTLSHNPKLKSNNKKLAIKTPHLLCSDNRQKTPAGSEMMMAGFSSTPTSEHPSRQGSPKAIDLYRYQPAARWTHPDLFTCRTSNYKDAVRARGTATAAVVEAEGVEVRRVRATEDLGRCNSTGERSTSTRRRMSCWRSTSSKGDDEGALSSEEE